MASAKGQEAVSPRTERYWRARYRAADQVYGHGYIGLIDNSHLRGNCGDKLPVESRELLNTFIEEKYENAVNPSLSAVHRLLKTACEDQSIQAPSYKTFCAAVKSRKSHEQTCKRRASGCGNDWWREFRNSLRSSRRRILCARAPSYERFSIRLRWLVGSLGAGDRPFQFNATPKQIKAHLDRFVIQQDEGSLVSWRTAANLFACSGGGNGRMNFPSFRPRSRSQITAVQDRF